MMARSPRLLGLWPARAPALPKVRRLALAAFVGTLVLPSLRLALARA
jgi:hypothetical protein